MDERKPETQARDHAIEVATYLRMLADQVERHGVVGVSVTWDGGAALSSELQLATPLRRISREIFL